MDSVANSGLEGGKAGLLLSLGCGTPNFCSENGISHCTFGKWYLLEGVLGGGHEDSAHGWINTSIKGLCYGHFRVITSL